MAAGSNPARDLFIINNIIMYDDALKEMLDSIEPELVHICVHWNFPNRVDLIRAIVDYLESHRDNYRYVGLCLEYIDFVFPSWVLYDIITLLINEKINKSNPFYSTDTKGSSELPF